MINVEEDSIEKIARDIKKSGNEVNVYEIESRISSLLSYTRFKMVEANDQTEHIQNASENIEGYNDSINFITKELHKTLEKVEDDFAHTGLPKLDI